MIKEFKSKLPILRDRFSVIFYDDPRELFEEHFKSYNWDVNYHNIDGGCFEIDDRNYIVFLLPNVTPGIIAHECKHFINIVFKNCGQKLDPDNDELECYFLKYIVDYVHKQWQKVTPGN